MKKLLSKNNLLLLAGVIALFHSLLGTLYYFMDVSLLNSLDYVLGGVLAAAALLHWYYYRPRLRANAEQVLLIVLLLWYGISCIVMTNTYQGNWLKGNALPLFDTAMLVLVVFALGRYSGKHGMPALLVYLVHVILLAWTAFMVYVLAVMLQNRIINLSNGGQIGFSRTMCLYLNCYYNTTGAIQIVAFLCCFCMVFWMRHPAMKAVYGLTSCVHYIILVFSNSRTALLSVLLGFAAIVGLAVFACQKRGALLRRILIAALAGAVAAIVFYLLRDVVFTTYEALTHHNELLGIETDGMRDMLGDSAFNLNNRTVGWKYSLKAMVYDTQKFFTGVTPISVISMLKLASDGVWDMYTHNEFLEIGVALGVPGMCLFIAWFALILKDCWHLFFIKKDTRNALFVPMILMVLTVANMAEATLMFYRFITSYAFFFFCGWVNGRVAPIEARKDGTKRKKGRK